MISLLVYKSQIANWILEGAKLSAGGQYLAGWFRKVLNFAFCSDMEEVELLYCGEIDPLRW